VPSQPDVGEVNARGDFGIEAERLAFIDGDRDPWRPAVSCKNGCVRVSDTGRGRSCGRFQLAMIGTLWVSGIVLITQTPGSDLAPKRKSSVSKPVHLIFGRWNSDRLTPTSCTSGGLVSRLTYTDGVHHYDQVSYTG
jgi:hypothetical protein